MKSRITTENGFGVAGTVAPAYGYGANFTFCISFTYSLAQPATFRFSSTNQRAREKEHTLRIFSNSQKPKDKAKPNPILSGYC